ncbi:replication initiation protein [Streptomyces sp. NBS 14/10]|uniref:replication initiator n=1 Tax=Streptomyces sp. NBS 14/10 TaxID=1945643 RepID=UPI000B7C6711|nr:replication initiator [Streptomyces sp. NBS 14/10]KAK1180891.1 replication initiation protein [Streptomyces sp. NBS 14/10]
MKRPLDLRHVASLALRDLIELAHLPDFARVHDQISRVRGCTRPVQLVGTTQTLDTTTNAVLRSYSTADEPTGRLLTACGNRRSSRCPACSRLYAADTYHLIKAGLSGGKQVPEAVRTHPRLFVTLTAPSFGPVHNRRTTDAGKNLACRCGTRHSADDPALGTPLAPATYDYAGAVLWNAHAGALWARFTTYLRRELAAHLGMTQKALNAALRVSFAKVAEYQRRGLVHFHAVIRLDGPEGSNQPPPAWATTDALTHAVKAATGRAVLTVVSKAVGERELRWGDQLDIREIAALGDGELTDQKVAAYVAKYATKSAEDSGTVDRSLRCSHCAGRGYQYGPDSFRDLCESCEGTGQSEPIADLPVHSHVRQMIRTAWDLGHLPEFAELKLWKWAHMLGFRGHFSSKSRRYSTTLGALRDVRRAWRAEQARPAGAPETNEETTLVLSHWQYLASGYSPGEELIAAQVRHDLTQAQQLKTEGAPWL